ncbi:MAG: hypothetical protein ACQESE_00155 [Nanobdellota archaeon]
MRKILLLLSIFSLLILSGCVVSEEKYTSLENDFQSLEQENSVLKEQTSSLKTELLSTEEELSSTKNELNVTKTNLAISHDYIELYQYLVTASYIEGSLDHQYWQIYNDPDGIYPSIFKDEYNEYKSHVSTTEDKIDRLIEKMDAESVSEKGLPRDLNSISDLEDLKAGFDLNKDTYKDEVDDFN